MHNAVCISLYQSYQCQSNIGFTRKDSTDNNSLEHIETWFDAADLQ